MKKCAICKTPFEPVFNSLEKVCLNSDCRFKYAMMVVEKNRKEKERTAKKEWSKTKEIYRTNTKKKSHYEKDLEKEINKICRLIDAGCTCISCNSKDANEAGHFMSVGSMPKLRYHLFNLWVQCRQCNGPKGGNPVWYRLVLNTIYGSKLLKTIDALVQIGPLNLSIPELKEKITEARLLVKEFEAANKMVQLPRNAAERLEMREYVNSRMNIYESK